MKVQVALKCGEKAQTFTANREWIIPRIVLKLTAGPLALLNVSFLVTDAEISDEDLLIGRPVPQHSGIDTRTVMEAQQSSLTETDCHNFRRAIKSTSKVGRVIIARIMRVRNEPLTCESNDTESSKKKKG